MNKLVNSSNLSTFAKGFHNLMTEHVDDVVGGKAIRYVTSAEFEALTDEEKNDESIVWNITDVTLDDYATKEYVQSVIEESSVKIVVLTQEEYDNLGDNVDPDTYYLISN